MMHEDENISSNSRYEEMSDEDSSTGVTRWYDYM